MTFEPGQLCREPGCRLPVGPTVLVAGDGHGNAISPARVNARCMYCRGEPTCASCVNVAQLGNLCRPCAALEHPGQIFFRGRWRTAEEAAFVIVSDRANRGVSWEVSEGQLIGRLGGYLIALQCDGEAVMKLLKEKPG